MRLMRSRSVLSPPTFLPPASAGTLPSPTPAPATPAPATTVRRKKSRRRIPGAGVLVRSLITMPPRLATSGGANLRVATLCVNSDMLLHIGPRSRQTLGPAMLHHDDDEEECVGGRSRGTASRPESALP